MTSQRQGCGPKTLEELVPAGIFSGTSLILRHPDADSCLARRLLFGLRPPLFEASRQILEATGIGGGLEHDDSSPVAGALREAREEIGCEVRLLDCGKTTVVYGLQRFEQVTLAAEVTPAAVVFRNHGTPPHQPWHHQNQGLVCVIVYLAELLGEPRPCGELPALLWLVPRLVVQLARRDMALAMLLKGNAELVEGQSSSLGGSALVRLTDSQEALVLALGEEAVAFYQRMLEQRPEVLSHQPTPLEGQG